MKFSGEELRKYRKKNAFSIPTLSDLTGIPADTLYLYEKGLSKPEPKRVEILATILHVDSAFLYSEQEIDKAEGNAFAKKLNQYRASKKLTLIPLSDKSQMALSVVKDDENAFGSLLSHYRSSRKMTLIQLSQKSQIAVTTINTLELGTRKPMLRHVYALATALGVSVESMITKELTGPELVEDAPCSNCGSEWVINKRKINRRQISKCLACSTSFELPATPQPKPQPAQQEPINDGNITFGELLKKFRVCRALSLRDLAQKANTNRTTLSLMERGVILPDGPYIVALASALNVAKETLITKELDFESHENPDVIFSERKRKKYRNTYNQGKENGLRQVPNKDEENAFGKIVKHYRLCKKLTLNELSENTKINESMLSKLERGKQQPHIKQILALSTALDIAVESLITKELKIPKLKEMFGT